MRCNSEYEAAGSASSIHRSQVPTILSHSSIRAQRRIGWIRRRVAVGSTASGVTLLLAIIAFGQDGSRPRNRVSERVDQLRFIQRLRHHDAAIERWVEYSHDDVPVEQLWGPG